MAYVGNLWRALVVQLWHGQRGKSCKSRDIYLTSGGYVFLGWLVSIFQDAAFLQPSVRVSHD